MTAAKTYEVPPAILQSPSLKTWMKINVKNKNLKL